MEWFYIDKLRQAPIQLHSRIQRVLPQMSHSTLEDHRSRFPFAPSECELFPFKHFVLDLGGNLFVRIGMCFFIDDRE